MLVLELDGHTSPPGGLGRYPARAKFGSIWLAGSRHGMPYVGGGGFDSSGESELARCGGGLSDTQADLMVLTDA